MGQKLDFLDGVQDNFFHLLTDYAQDAPADEHRHQPGSRQRKLKVKVKGQGKMGQKLDLFRLCTA